MIKLLIDTSVWSEALRRKDKSLDSSETLVRRIIENNDEIVIIGIILQEILSGITDKKLFSEIETILNDFSYIDIMKEDYIYAAELRNKCKQKGIIAGSYDFLIASVAIRNKLALVTYDKDFINISKYTELKILDEAKYLKLKNSI
ncbi:MAG TPA: PIN domain-containing protein [Spirochaetota bacterium]|nr:PIN domain-containing protein [Spirochaetota bacterium]HPJ44312.1 PIN domain-containing protein [Spirochaetota bacterium]